MSPAETRDVDIIKLVDVLILEGLKVGASDLPIDPMRDRVEVRYRIDGLLQKFYEMPLAQHPAVVIRVKVMAGLDLTERRRPLYGHARTSVGDRTVELRIGIIPTRTGDKVVIRLADASGEVLALEALGLLPHDYERLAALAGSPQGLVAVVGPAGSGRTTTAYALLGHMDRCSRNVVTVEDPPDRTVEGVHQLQLDPREGLTWASILRSVLRQDPDVILVGEIPDRETAELLLSAAGHHLVLTILDAPTAVGAFPQLYHRGLSPLAITALQGVVAQRLVRRVCPECREQARPSSQALRFFSLATGRDAPEWVPRAKGCELCRGTGYRGRLGLFEVLLMTDPIRELLLREAAPTELLEGARIQGMRTLAEDGLAKVELGLTTPEEVMRVASTTASRGRLCESCNRRLEDDYRICPWCSDGAQDRCRCCGRVVHSEWRACPYCTYTRLT